MNYTYGTQVSLTASANSGYVFSSWSGDLSGTATTGNVLMTDNRSVTANFTLGDQPNLRIPSQINASSGNPVEVPIYFTPSGKSISSTTFSIDFDESCLSFDDADANLDGIPDSITFTIPSTFSGGATFNAADTDGEIDFTIADLMAPLSSLPESQIAKIRFTPTCSPDPGQNILAAVGFSNDPSASFGDNLGQNVPGTVTPGSVEITNGVPGDANGDGSVNAGDISAIVLEIFDGDGTDPANTPNGEYAFNPVGCDANSDGSVECR